MALKTVKITRYYASDGTEFEGSGNKGVAEKYEKNCQDRIKDYRRQFKMLQDLNNLLADKILSQYNIRELANPKNRELIDDYYEECSELIDKLFKDSMCPDDLNDIEEVINMVCYIIDNFGGIGIINQIYTTYHKTQKGAKKK